MYYKIIVSSHQVSDHNREPMYATYLCRSQERLSAVGAFSAMELRHYDAHIACMKIPPKSHLIASFIA